jgi:hypothetical protein
VSYSSSLPPLRDTNIPLAVLVRILMTILYEYYSYQKREPIALAPGADLHFQSHTDIRIKTHFHLSETLSPCVSVTSLPPSASSPAHSASVRLSACTFCSPPLPSHALTPLLSPRLPPR